MEKQDSFIRIGVGLFCKKMHRSLLQVILAKETYSNSDEEI